MYHHVDRQGPNLNFLAIVVQYLLIGLTEFVPGKSSSAVAVQNFIRNICACIGGVITAPLLHSLGEGVLFSIFGGIGLASMIIIWIMKKYGPRWREKVGDYDLT